MTNDKSTEPTNDNLAEPNRIDPVMTQEALAQMGDGRLAYVKPIRSEDVAEMFPQAPQIAPGIQLFALHAADGRPILLTGTREAALANAWSQELEAVSLH
jgi:hypothetical protein